MDRSWYWKAGFILAVALLSVYALVPSVSYFQLPADQRNESGVFDSVRPKWAPPRHLNLGLDLQGGIHLVMGVEVDRAVREKAVRRAEELTSELERKDVKGATVTGDVETGIVTVTAKDPGDPRQGAHADHRRLRRYVRPRPGRRLVHALDEGRRGQAAQGLGGRSGDQGDPQPRRQVGRHRAHIPAAATRTSWCSCRAFGPGEGQGAARPHRAAGVQDCRRRRRAGHRAQGQAAAGRRARLRSAEGEGGAIVGAAYLHAARIAAAHHLHRPRTRSPPGASGASPPGRSHQEGVDLPHLHPRQVDASSPATYITDARVAFDQLPGAGQPAGGGLNVRPPGRRALGKLTTDNVGRLMAIVLDDNVESAPIIEEPMHRRHLLDPHGRLEARQRGARGGQGPGAGPQGRRPAGAGAHPRGAHGRRLARARADQERRLLGACSACCGAGLHGARLPVLRRRRRRGAGAERPGRARGDGDPGLDADHARASPASCSRSAWRSTRTCSSTSASARR